MGVPGQNPQVAHREQALAGLRTPTHMTPGDQDDCAPLETAERLAAETVTRRPIRVVRTHGANHFLNDGPAEVLIAAIEDCIPRRKPVWSLRWPKLWTPWGLKLPGAFSVD